MSTINPTGSVGGPKGSINFAPMKHSETKEWIECNCCFDDEHEKCVAEECQCECKPRVTPPETSSWEEELKSALIEHNAIAFSNDCFEFNHCDSIKRIRKIVASVASLEYKRGVEDSIEKASEIVHGGGAKEEVIPAIKTLIK